MSSPELLASYWTIAGGALPHTEREFSPFDFKDRVIRASRVGFTGIGLWHADLEHIVERYSLSEMRQILRDHGIRHVELEFLTDWFLDGERKRRSDLRKQKLLEAAQSLGARHIKVGDFYREKCPMTELVERFAALCGDAAAAGVKVGFELMPFAMIDTLSGALEMIRAAGAANGGLVLDLWHLVKLGIPYEALLAIPPDAIVSVELNDGTFQAPWSLHEDTVNHRQFCGEGEFDVQGFIQVIAQLKYTGPWGIEVLSEELRTWPLERATQKAFETTFRQFAAWCRTRAIIG